MVTGCHGANVASLLESFEQGDVHINRVMYI
jgi:hypothetical protein